MKSRIETVRFTRPGRIVIRGLAEMHTIVTLHNRRHRNRIFSLVYTVCVRAEASKIEFYGKHLMHYVYTAAFERGDALYIKLRRVEYRKRRKCVKMIRGVQYCRGMLLPPPQDEMVAYGYGCTSSREAMRTVLHCLNIDGVDAMK